MFPRGRAIGVPAAFCDSLVRMLAERVALPEHVGLSTNRLLARRTAALMTAYQAIDD